MTLSLCQLTRCLLIVGTLSALSDAAGFTARFKPNVITVPIGVSKNVSLIFSAPLNETAWLYFNYDRVNVISNISKIGVLPGKASVIVTITGQSAGDVGVGINSTSPIFTGLKNTYIEVMVVHSQALYIVSVIVGWLYFLAWSISYYPQIITNWKRKSVIGLNFDYLALNITGFVMYSMFNIGLYWIPEIQTQYNDAHPRKMIPVQLNDVIFAIHAFFATSFTILQVFIYERGNQKVSRLCWLILVVFGVVVLICLILTLVHHMTWLKYLYVFSYIKLIVTLTKYTPQAVMNFRRKSTDGWSIGNVLLDFTGGFFSLMQMFMLAYNANDWDSLFGNPTKFGLGVFSMAFDLVFMFQHYVLYKDSPRQEEYDSLRDDRSSINDETERLNRTES